MGFNSGFKGLNGSKDINRAWENIKENIKISAINSLSPYEFKQHKPWFNEKCLRFLEQTMQAKIQWAQDRNQSNLDNLNNVRCKTIDISASKGRNI